MADSSCAVQFQRKHVNSVKNNLLSGLTLLPWAKILWRQYQVIEWRTYWLRLFFLTFMAVLNTILSCFDWLFYGAAIQKAKINDAPVFILGHPRTGTTLVHNVLSLDEQFAVANTFKVGFPASFLSLEKYGG